jgi:hypothetical protein
MSDRMLPEDEEPYPNLIARGYRKTSKLNPNYNCVAWALDWITSRWIDHTEPQEPGCIWPDDVPKGPHVENYMRLFAKFGYVPCNGPELEDGFDKVAFWDDQHQWGFAHVARQLPNGHWTSKLGNGNDIEHNTLDAINCGNYPNAFKFMKRPYSSRPNDYREPEFDK